MNQVWDVVIVGGGLAGYVAANYLEGTNLSVLLLEKGKVIGGRARTNKIKQQYLNLGPHALYKKGKASAILNELNLTLHGKSPKLDGILIENGFEYVAPFSPVNLVKTNLLNWKERTELMAVLMKLMTAKTDQLEGKNFYQWTKEITRSRRIELFLYTLGRLATYCHDPKRISAAVMVSHIKTAMQGVLYLDGGWQSLIDQLHNRAILSGVQVQTHTTVKQIVTQEQFSLRLSTDETIIARNVIWTGGPHELANVLTNTDSHSLFQELIPIKGATLDVALTQLPDPNKRFAMDIASPLYYSVHSDYAHLSDDANSTVLHAFKYHHSDEQINHTNDQVLLEKFLDKLQPGWQDFLITKRFLPAITVNQRLPQVGDEQKLLRMKSLVPGLYLAGDWTSPIPFYLKEQSAVANKPQKTLFQTKRGKALQISNQEYQQLKPLLFSLGYRLLGSVVETEDMLQETFLKASFVDEQNIENKKAYLCKMMTNRCLDLLKSKSRREKYIGPWNPEPLFQEKLQAIDPSASLLQKEGLSIAYLRMMEHLKPDERAVLLLREVFDFPYAEIATIIEKKEENCRKICSRAKQKIAKVEGESLDYEKNKTIIDRFIEAFQIQDTATLLELISESVTLFSDGGGKVKAAIRPIESFSNVLAFLFGIYSKAPTDFYFKVNRINNQPAIILYMNGALQSIMSFYIVDEKIKEIYITMNPDKINQ